MSSDNQYEPNDSRNVTGAGRSKDGRWSGDREPRTKGGEYEPRDSRNVTGTASTPDGRWTGPANEMPEGVPDSQPFTAEEAASSPAKAQKRQS